MDVNAADVRGTPVGSGRPEGEPLPSLTAADVEFVDALRSALATDPMAATRPGQLRQKVETALGPDEAARRRPLVHQVVAAAEENLPGYLTRIMPLTAQSLRQLSDELAGARGWNDATAQRVTQIWAHALGFSGVADDWPDQEPTAPPSPVVDRTAPRGPLPVDGATALPPAAVVANHVSSEPAPPLPAPPMSAPSAAPPMSTPKEPTPWPAPSRRLARRHSRSSGGEPALGIVRAYAGMSLRLYIAIAVVFVALIILGIVLFHLIVGVIPVLLVVFLMRRALKDGVLVATATGLEFTPYTAFGNRPKRDGVFSAPWGEVTGEDGPFAIFEMAGRRIQLGPLSRRFASAAVEHTGRGA